MARHSFLGDGTEQNPHLGAEPTVRARASPASVWRAVQNFPNSDPGSIHDPCMHEICMSRRPAGWTEPVSQQIDTRYYYS